MEVNTIAACRPLARSRRVNSIKQQLMTQTRRPPFKIAAVQPDLGTPFRQSQIPAVIASL